MKSSNNKRKTNKESAGLLGLYAITTKVENRSHIDVAKAALEGGAKVIQYREKNESSKNMFRTAESLRVLTKEHSALLIINDRIDIAQAVGADGIHLGQDDLDIKIARSILGDDYIIGISATCLEEAIEAEQNGADYVGAGPVFPTPSKDDAAKPFGLETLTAIRQSVDIPIVAIGGISSQNVKDVIKAGADGIAVISAIALASDMRKAAKILLELINQVKHCK